MKPISILEILDTKPDVVLVDASGVLYSDSGPHDGVPETIDQIQSAKVPVLVVTNNSYNSPVGIETRLAAMGIKIPAADVISSGYGLSQDSEIRQLLQGKRVFVFGAAESHYYLSHVPGAIIEPDVTKADVVVLAATVDDQVDQFNRLMDELSDCSIPVICCNPDRYVMTDEGRYPVIGYYADRLAEELNIPIFFVGKPHLNFSKIVAESLRKRYSLTSFSGVFFFDDNPDNVRQLARDTGVRGVLVQDTGLASEMQFQEIELYQLEFVISAFSTT